MKTESILLDFAGALASFAGAILKLLLPLLVGLILAYLLNGPVTWLEKRIRSRPFAIFLTYITAGAAFAALIYGFIILIIGALPKGSPAETLASIENYYTDAVHAVYDFLGKYIPAASDGSRNLLSSLRNRLYEAFSPSSVLTAIYSLIGGFASLFVGIVASVYLLKDKEFFIGLWEKFLCLTVKQKMHGIICEVMQDINKVLSTFIRGAIPFIARTQHPENRIQRYHRHNCRDFEHHSIFRAVFRHDSCLPCRRLLKRSFLRNCRRSRSLSRPAGRFQLYLP